MRARESESEREKVSEEVGVLAKTRKPNLRIWEIIIDFGISIFDSHFFKLRAVPRRCRLNDNDLNIW